VENGVKVYISSRKKDACDRVAHELSAVGTCVSLPADLGTEAGARQLGESIAARESALHILVNNAGGP
jgi:short-subunit dehydrogenase